MPKDRIQPPDTVGLNTKLEEDFVAPLTAVRGVLEILRDHPDLSEDQRRPFLDRAIRECGRLEKGIHDLGTAVYEAGRRVSPPRPGPTPEQLARFAGRVKILDDRCTMEIDFSNFTFSDSHIVNDFFDVIDDAVDRVGENLYFLVNYSHCSIWPEAWVAFAHRGMKVNATHSLGTVHYIEAEGDDFGGYGAMAADYDPNMFSSRNAALTRITEMKAAARS